MNYYNKIKSTAIKVMAISAIISLLIPNIAFAAAMDPSPTISPTSYTASTASNVTVNFTTVTALSAGGGFIMDMDETAGFTAQSGIDYTDVDVKINSVEQDIGETATPSLMGAVYNTPTNKWTFTFPTLTPIGGGSTVEVQIGTHATQGDTGDKQQIAASTPGEGYYLTVYTGFSPDYNGVDGGGTVVFTVNAAAAAPEFSDIILLVVILMAGGMIYHTSQRQKGLTNA